MVTAEGVTVNVGGDTNSVDGTGMISESWSRQEAMGVSHQRECSEKFWCFLWDFLCDNIGVVVPPPEHAATVEYNDPLLLCWCSVLVWVDGF